MCVKDKKLLFKQGVILFIILILFALLLCGCSKKPEKTEEKSQPIEKKQTTLMVYMIGSDLEAKGGKGTADMEEMADSGIDLSKNNVVVFTGGAPKWHNDNVTKEQHHLLELGAEGFVQKHSMPDSSMGEAETLSSFLNYAYENYPAHNYALVMWDHGNGPVIGYGKDMLYDNDSLTLKEMQTALDNSPFAEGGLDWVGFDACLMASAELASVWSRYANYLVASQEVEPSFGWNYAVLEKLSKTDTPAFLEELAQLYLSTCEEYYESRDFSNSDTTLALFDLSRTAELEDAIAALFTAASGDISENYNTLTVRRVETRALGRASTGSEYDLIDLRDMAQKLSEIYTEESEALISAIDGMIITNATNAEKCSGISLYYPFFNKSYYKKEWKDVYTELGVFPEYLEYLDSYADTWLDNDFLESYARSDMPSASGEQTFSLQLSDGQAETVAKARYYILEKMGEDLYKPVYYGSNVKKEGNVLTAGFDGEILYATDTHGNRYLTTIAERDTVGDITRYSVPVIADNRLSFDEEEEQISSTAFFYELAVNNLTKEISLTGMTPIDTSGLAGGKTEDVDLSNYTLFKFFYIRPSYLRRYDNGVIQPFDDWTESGAILYREVPISDFIGFDFEAPDISKFYLMFEMEDTQGNKYCSELLSVQNPNGVKEYEAPEQLMLEWKDGDSFELGEYSGVKLSIGVKEYNGEKKYALTVENTNDFTVEMSCFLTYVNGNIDISGSTGFGMTDIAPGESITSPNGISYGEPERLGLLDSLTSMTLCIRVINAATEGVLTDSKLIYLTLPEDKVTLEKTFTGFETMRVNLHAEEQEIYNENGISVTLLGMGKDSYYGLKGILLIENASDFPKFFEMEQITFDGIGVPVNCSRAEIMPGSRVYCNFGIDSENMDMYNLFSAKDVSFLLTFADEMGLVVTAGLENSKCDVELSAEGDPAVFREGKTVIFEEKGARIALIKGKTGTTSDKYDWYVSVINEGSENYVLSFYDIKVNGEESSTGLSFDYDNKFVASGEKKIIKISAEKAENLSGKIRLFDSSKGKILYESDETIDFFADSKPLS